MTKNAIKNAAMNRFAEQGYDATAMSEIAGDVGIKAPAIYAHFRSKEELFKELLRTAIEQELSTTKQRLDQDGRTEDILWNFLQSFGVRFEEDPHLRFLLHVYYLPPQKIKHQLLPIIDEYNDKREGIISNIFNRLPPSRLQSEQLAEAYLGIIDSVQAEALYGGREKFQKRLEALWELFRLAFHA